MEKRKNYVPPKMMGNGSLYLEAALLSSSNPPEVPPLDFSATADGQEYIEKEYASDWE